ncbi:hypothetical protein [Mitsuaria sp. TWR114]|uniref:hypothetical protein n=1 Tax=Mitsuaria sp. TWR114 TaxID=2601731 RepID=UPI00164C1D27|nr:hypothetical protein [Mitsuaria sp. TWR114]
MRSSIRAAAVRVTALVTAVAFVSACSTASKDISATYVSPSQYSSYDCTQLTAETQRLQARYLELGGRLDQAATNDKTLMGVGLILFWPALFALGGTKSQEAEYGRLRGEYDAVQQTLIQKRCASSDALAAVSPAAQARRHPKAPHRRWPPWPRLIRPPPPRFLSTPLPAPSADLFHTKATRPFHLRGVPIP